MKNPGRLLLSMVSIMIAPVVSASGDKAVEFQGIVIPDMSGAVMTVMGPVAPDMLGATLMHEHLFVDLARAFAPGAAMGRPATDETLKRWAEPFETRRRGELLYDPFGTNCDMLVLDDPADAKAEIEDFRASGGGAIVDVTVSGLGRRPVALRDLARTTGVKLVMGTGFYRAGWHPADIGSRSIDDITRMMVSDIVKGADGTGIRAGIIGEIGAEDLRLTPAESNEVRVLRAAARASQLTGAAVTIHNSIGHSELWHTALDILEREGADMGRVVAGHITGVDADFVETLIRRGVYVQFDTLGAPFFTQYPMLDTRPNMLTILELIKRGHASRILVSQDVCTKAQLHRHGGFGYEFVLRHLVPFLRANGVSQADIDQIVIGNPAHVLSFVKPRPYRTRIRE